jgi:hypothetical protein
MANGKKNYFRHSFFAGSDDKIVDLISKHGKQAYFHFFRLLELCGQQSGESVPEKFVFHRRTLCGELLVTNSRLGHHLLAMQSSLLLHYVLTDSKVEILVHNFPKYLGKYTNKIPSNTPNKIKEKEIKVKESKVIKLPLKEGMTDEEIKELLPGLKEWAFPFARRMTADYLKKNLLSAWMFEDVLRAIEDRYLRDQQKKEKDRDKNVNAGVHNWLRQGDIYGTNSDRRSNSGATKTNHGGNRYLPNTIDFTIPE